MNRWVVLATLVLISSCSTKERQSKMSKHFGMLKQEQEAVARVAEPAPIKKNDPEAEMLRILETSGFDSEAAIATAEEKKIETSSVAPDIASLVEAAEQNVAASTAEVESVEAVSTNAQKVKTVKVSKKENKSSRTKRVIASAPAYTGPVCLSIHPALRRLQSDRMKIQSFHSDKEKYYGQIMRSYKDMGGVDTVKNEYEKHETLQIISQKTYGTTLRWPEIYILNKDIIEHYDHLPPGAAIETPVVDFARHCADEPDPNIGLPARMTSNPEDQ